MLDRLTLDAVNLIERATEVARQFGHSYIGPEHLLVAFAAREGSPESEALKELGLVESVLSQQIENMFGRKDAHSLNLRFNGATKDLIETAKQRFVPAQADLVSSKHIFKVLMAERGGVVDNIFRILNVSDEPSEQVLDKPSEHLLEQPFVQTAPDSVDETSSLSGLNRSSTVLKGDLAFVQLSALLQSIALARMTGRLEIDSEVGGKAEVYFTDGQPVHATSPGLEGGECIYNLITWTEGRFFFQPKVQTESKTITDNLDSLMIQGAQPFDKLQSIKNSGFKTDCVLTQAATGKRTADLTLNSEIPMAEGDFTEAANFALLFARLEAATFNFASRRIDSNCLLVGLALERSGAAGKMLRRRGATVRHIRGAACDSISQKLLPKDLECLVFDSHVRRIVQTARKMSRVDGHSFVSSLHLLEAILSSGPSKAKDVLAKLIDDAATFRAFILRQETRDYEGSLDELALNDKIFRFLEAGERPPEHLLEESMGVAPCPTPIWNFDLAHLTAEGLAVMEAALGEYLTMRCAKFDSQHILLGLLSEGRSQISRYLASWGVSLQLARCKVAVRESASATLVPEIGTDLDDYVAELLTSALSLAKQSGESKAGPEHLFLALTRSDQPPLKLLIERLGLDAGVLVRDASNLCLGRGPLSAKYSTSFATLTKDGLLIYAIICEPGVAGAMEVALKEAQAAGASEVTGGFLLLGLLVAPGGAGEILRSMGIQIDTARSALKQLYGLKPPDDAVKQSSDAPGKAKRKYIVLGEEQVGSGRKSRRDAKEKVQVSLPEIDFAHDLESAFNKALAISLRSHEAAVATQHLLQGLIESGDQAFLNTMDRCEAAISVVLEKLEASKRRNLVLNPAASAVESLVARVDMKVSPKLHRMLEIAAEAAFYVGAHNLDLPVLIYALSLAQAGSVSDKLFNCGLDRNKLKKHIQARASKSRTQLANQLQIEVLTLAVVEGAERLAEALGSEVLHPEHLMMAILEACLQGPNKQMLLQVGLNAESLAMQLCLAGPVSTRLQNLQFGPDLVKQVSQMDFAAEYAVVNAGAFAATGGRNFIDTEQLLLAICSCSKTKLLKLLQDSGVSAVKVEQRIDHYSSPVMEYSSWPMTFSFRMKAIFEQALMLAVQSNYELIGVEHLLVALLKEPGGIASRIFDDLGVSREEIAAKLELGPFTKTEQQEQDQPQDTNDSALKAVNTAEAPPIQEPARTITPASNLYYPNAMDSAKSAGLQDKMSTWFNRALMAYQQGSFILSKEALYRGWAFLRELGAMQGFTTPENPREPEYYFGKDGVGMPTLRGAHSGDRYLAFHASPDPEGSEPPRREPVAEPNPWPREFDRLSAFKTPLDPQPPGPPRVEIDLSVFAPETAAIFSAAQNLAEGFPRVAESSNPFIEPWHFLIALIVMPDLAQLLCSVGVDKILARLGPPITALLLQSLQAAVIETDSPAKSKAKGKGAQGKPAQMPRKPGEHQKPESTQEPQKSEGSAEPHKSERPGEPHTSEGPGESQKSGKPGEIQDPMYLLAPLDFSRGTRELLGDAYAECRLLRPKDGRISPEHLLLAILAKPDQRCSLLLVQLGVEPDAARFRLLGYINDRARKR